MVKKTSRVTPQHRHWYEDLPERDAPLDRMPKLQYADVNFINEIYFEVSRSSILMRGVNLFGGVFGFVFFFWVISFLGYIIFPLDDETFKYVFIFIFLILMAFYLIFLTIKTDLMIPRDRPIRFNSKQGEVYVYDYSYGINPFVKWSTSIKRFDWNTLHAEIHRQAGSNGKVYIQRFAVWLVSVKPGTNEVVDRFELKGNSPTRAELYDIWAYCRQYMEQGPAGLPSYPPRRQDITFRRSFFEYMRFLDPTQEGREERQQMNAFEWVVNVIVFVTAFWLLIPLGVCHYIAMRFAPDVNWPPEIDAESRSA